MSADNTAFHIICKMLNEIFIVNDLHNMDKDLKEILDGDK
jgi:hypothetical protein